MALTGVKGSKSQMLQEPLMIITGLITQSAHCLSDSPMKICVAWIWVLPCERFCASFWVTSEHFRIPNLNSRVLFSCSPKQRQKRIALMCQLRATIHFPNIDASVNYNCALPSLTRQLRGICLASPWSRAFANLARPGGQALYNSGSTSRAFWHPRG